MMRSFADEDRVFPIGKCNVQIDRELHRMSDVAGVRRVTCHAIRRLACTEWQRAKWGAGEVLQGSAIKGSAARYITPQILSEAAHCVQWPSAMITDADRKIREADDQRIILMLNKLDADNRQTLLKLAERLAS